MGSWRWGMAAAVLGVALAGCGGDSGGLSLAELPARLDDISCQANVQCGLFPDEAACRAVTTTFPDQLQADVSAGKIRYDGAQAAICLDAFKGAVGSCRLSDARRVAPSPACKKTFVGTVATDGPCFSDEECVSGACARLPCALDTCCPGTCAFASTSTGTVPVGAACTSAVDCVSGAFCAFNPRDPQAVCTALIVEDQLCQSNDQCAPGLACIQTPKTRGARVCAKPPGEGEACADVNGCDLPGDFCDLAALKCTPRHAVGAPCDQRSESCVRYALCDPITGTCVARGAVGAACNPAAIAPTCLGGLICDTGVCAVPSAEPVCPQI